MFHLPVGRTFLRNRLHFKHDGLLIHKFRVSHASGRLLSTSAPERRPVQPFPLAFAFDIDGVLLRGPDVLPAAKRALEFLEGNNPLNLTVPYILMTNGGGVTEAERCTKLSRQLERPIIPSQLVQAHTVLKSLKHKYLDKPVLVLGGRGAKGREVVESYGFTQVYTPLDVLAWDPSIWPFHKLTDSERSIAKVADFSRIQFEAVLVIHDPIDWAMDIQVASDLLRSSTKAFRQPFRSISGPDVHGSDHIELVFCNPDLVWRSDYPQTRFGQGAFKTAFQAVFKEVAGVAYPYTQYGKPHTPTYKFAAEMLKARTVELGAPLTDAMPPIFMVGDNPVSDIAGANAANWGSLLVRTGVYDPKDGPPAHKPTEEVEDVEEAVHWAFERVTGLSPTGRRHLHDPEL